MNRAQVQFFIGVFIWLAILQAFLLFFVWRGDTFVCNGSSAWPISFLSFLGNGLVTLIATLVMLAIAWMVLSPQKEENEKRKLMPEAIFWSLIVGTGISHTIERLSSGCILDYWQAGILGKDIHFNLGDIALMVATTALVLGWLYSWRIGKRGQKICL